MSLVGIAGRYKRILSSFPAVTAAVITHSSPFPMQLTADITAEWSVGCGYNTSVEQPPVLTRQQICKYENDEPIVTTDVPGSAPLSHSLLIPNI